MIYVYDPAQDKIVPKGTEVAPRSINIITDSMGPLVNHANGQTYDSKSAFRNTTRNLGYREIGSDSTAQPREVRGDFNVRNDLKRAVQQHLR